MQGRVNSQRVALLGTLLAFACLFWLATIGTGDARAADVASLDTIAVPKPPAAVLSRYVADAGAAVKLGKALFWDMQAGSDGRQACASCHFNAGEDSRSKNTIGLRNGGFTIAGQGANSQLTEATFPLHDAAGTAPNQATTNVIGSQGVIPSTFAGVTPGNGDDNQVFANLDAEFQAGGVNVRRSTGRNTPSVINAVFNYRNFWDGRAQNDFNGVDPFGSRDANARVFSAGAGGAITKIHIGVDTPAITNSSLASQADGPPGNNVEMSSDGRSLADIGVKLLALKPLGEQQVSASDSVLGDNVDASGRGLNVTYSDLIAQAFQPEWWSSAQPVAIGQHLYTQTQANFSLFWGLAIQAYEQTLVSDQDPFDQGADTPGTPAGIGMTTFNGKCAACHTGAALSSASVANINSVAGTAAAGNADGTITLNAVSGNHDTGFENIGASPDADDPGQACCGANSDPNGNTLSITDATPGLPGVSGVLGTFKVPDLRNVELTAPYFHNGSKETLDQVLELYRARGDFQNAHISNTLAGGVAQPDPNMEAFLNSLTDPRVKAQSAPFDHPELFVAQGEQVNGNGTVKTTVDANGNVIAVDCFQRVPATGAAGGAALPTFKQGLQGVAPLGCSSPPAVAKAAAAPPPVTTTTPTTPTTTTTTPTTTTTTPVVTKPAAKVVCRVPTLKGKTVAAAKKALTKAHCNLGHVTRSGKLVKGATYVVTKQQFKAKSVQRKNRGVRVTVARKKHK